MSKNDTMKVYMQDIGQISLVTKEEEVDLAAKIHGTDPKAHEEARATLIQANLRLVVKIAHDFKGLGLPLLDLISEGNIGLMRAGEKFDPAKGAKFSSYAAWWIKQSMRRALANQSRTIRIPVQSAGKINKIKSVRMKLTEELGREPTDAEIAEHLDSFLLSEVKKTVQKNRYNDYRNRPCKNLTALAGFGDCCNVAQVSGKRTFLNFFECLDDPTLVTSPDNCKLLVTWGKIDAGSQISVTLIDQNLFD
ncbi:MAG: sigma-70 family RNA polymerase sigma factor [Spirochaetia bacterium]|nr:sigma-70 family RNA polymerase sigma factor [Spirochaetia bacterium]